MNRANFIPAPHYFNLSMACRILADAWGHHVYLVGSSLEKREYRDVDVRMILPDKDFETMFPGLAPDSVGYDARWSIMCASISLYLSQHSGLPVDFQIQQQTTANASDPKGRRHALGIFLEPKRAE